VAATSHHLQVLRRARLVDAQKRGGLPAARDVVAYCHGPYCVMALDAVDLLRRSGFRAHRLELGLPEWRAQGWRVETGQARLVGSRP
jgi:DNA-binding transcriptional ArsR family regulator